VVNALSKYLKAEVFRDGAIYTQEYSQGKPLTPVKKMGGVLIVVLKLLLSLTQKFFQ